MLSDLSRKSKGDLPKLNSSLDNMYKDRSPAPQSRLDSLLKRQADSLSQGQDSWKAFRSEVRATEPGRKIEELKALNRQSTPLARSPNHSFSRDTLQLSSPLRERLGGPLFSGHIQSSSVSSAERRYQSPVAKARDQFEAFYESLKQGNAQVEKKSVLDRLQTLSRGQLPPRSPTNFDVRLQSLTAVKRNMSPPRRTEDLGKDPRGLLPSVLPLESLRQAREAMQRTGLQGVSASYASELRALAEEVLAAQSAEEAA